MGSDVWHVFALFAARNGRWMQLLCRWALYANTIQCKYTRAFYMLTFISISNNHCVTCDYGNLYLHKTDDGSKWNSELVRNSCWLVGRKVASKSLSGARCHLWAPEEYNCMFLCYTLIDLSRVMSTCQRSFKFISNMVLIPILDLAAVNWHESPCYKR